MLKCIAAMAVATCALPAGDDTLRLGTRAHCPAWEPVNAAGKMDGFDIDVGNAVCEKIRATFEWTKQAHQGLLPALQAGQ